MHGIFAAAVTLPRQNGDSVMVLGMLALNFLRKSL